MQGLQMTSALAGVCKLPSVAQGDWFPSRASSSMQGQSIFGLGVSCGTLGCRSEAARRVLSSQVWV